MSGDEDSHPVPTVPMRTSPPVNWRRAGIKLIPYIGSSLDEVLYGQLHEMRWQRLERTLSELGAMMEAREIPAEAINNENFGALLELVGPAAACAVEEDRRILFRDLLLNASQLPPSDPEWESARLAAELVAELDTPALAIMAGLDRAGARGEETAYLQRNGDTAQIRYGEDETIDLHYNWFVIEKAYRHLSMDFAPRLVVAGAHGKYTYEKIAITAFGEFLVDWIRAKP